MPTPRSPRTRLHGAFSSLAPPVRLQRTEIGLLALLGAAAFSQGWSSNVFTTTLAHTRVTFTLDDQDIALVEVVVRATALLALGLAWWADRRGRRGPLLVAFSILPLANLATAFAPTLASFAGLQGVARIGTIGLGTLGLLILAEEINPAGRGYAAGVFSLGLSMGTGFGWLIAPVAERSPEAWRSLFAASALPLLLLPLLAWRLRETRAFRPGTHAPLSAALQGGLARRFWPMAGLSFTSAAFTGLAAGFINPRLVNDLGWSQGGASLLMVLAITPAVLAGLLAGGRAADLIGRRPTEAVAAVVGVAGGITAFYSENGWAIAAGVFLAILGSSAFAPAFTSQRAELFPTAARAAAGSWMVNAGILGALGGFLGGHFVIGALGVPGMVAVLGGVLLASLALLLLLPETKGADLIGGSSAASPSAEPA